MNKHLLLTEPTHYRISYQINPFMHIDRQPNPTKARDEHAAIVAAHVRAGRIVKLMPSANDCPDMIYTANAAIVRGNRAILSKLPKERQGESGYHHSWLAGLGLEVIRAPFLFSGQGDALPCGNLLLTGYGHRTDRRMHPFLHEQLGYEVIPLHTVNPLWFDLDLAVAILDDHTIAYCPDALDLQSRHTLASIGLDLMEVELKEASSFALNLISDGETITMTAGAPRFAARLRAHGFSVIELETTEIHKGGGGVRCTALTLDYPHGPGRALVDHPP